ncbi:tetratricopeptide repeat protein [Thalassolituus oleivorans]|uniref:tetratricopeptide repeat protein n=1 Tax=Thalassolituus oleivorans TaxID=187493 RepID=UPI0023F2ECF3|nr:tetratricopeptide repeat protein [Thalassolituus oleivorans]
MMDIQDQMNSRTVRHGRFWSACLITVYLIFSVGQVHAAADSVSSGTYKKLTAIQEQIAANQLNEATKALAELYAEVEADSIDAALVLQMQGYTEMGKNDYPKAIAYLRKSLDLNRLPESIKYRVGYMVAQLYAAQGQFDEALTFAKEWFSTLENPTPDQSIFMANIFAQTKNYLDAIPYASAAINKSESPKESWFQLLIACYFEVKNYQGAESTLKQAISLWPEKPSYWEQLASVYITRGDELKGLATLQLAWKSGVLDKESSIRSMIQLAITEGIPEHGARLLAAAIDKEALPKNEKYLDLLANAWVAAKESSQAITAFEQLATVTGSGNPYVRIANLYLEKAQWEKAEEAVRSALSKDVDKPGNVWVSLGIALTEQTKFSDGMKAFRNAIAYDYAERRAKSWLKYAEDLKRQHNWVNQNS